MTVTAQPPATAEGPHGKGLKTGALGLLSSVVIGVSSTAPGYSLAATLGFVVALVGFQAPIIMILAFVPMFFIAYAYRELNRVAPGLRHDVHLGHQGIRTRRPAGWAAGASSPPTSSSWPAWRRSPASTAS